MHEILKAVLGRPFQVYLCKSLNRQLLFLGDLHIIKGSIAPLDIADTRDGELNCDLLADLHHCYEGERTEYLGLKAKTQDSWSTDEKLILPQLIWIKVFKLDGGALPKNRVLWSHFLNSRAGIVGFVLLETDGIHHDPTLNVPTDDFAFIIKVECRPLILPMMDTHQGDILAAVFNKLSPGCVWFGVVLERICREKLDPLGSPEDINFDTHSGFPEHPSVTVQAAGTDVEVSRTISSLHLLAVIVNDASRCTSATAGSINLCVRPEKGPQQVICNLLPPEKLVKVLLDWAVGSLDVF